MSVLPIVTFDDEVLREETFPVKKNSDELQQMIDDMFDTMYNAEGVGLAAPQIGEPLRIFVADADVYAEKDEEEKARGPMVMINPSISLKSDETIGMEEGCLSIPEVNGVVNRPANIEVSFSNRDFKEQKMQVDGHLARVIQHEIDHLDGVLFIDHLSYFKRKLLASKLKALAVGEKQIAYPVVGKKKQEV
jgi:peptide deformylase